MDGEAQFTYFRNRQKRLTEENGADGHGVIWHHTHWGVYLCVAVFSLVLTILAFSGVLDSIVAKIVP